MRLALCLALLGLWQLGGCEKSPSSKEAQIRIKAASLADSQVFATLERPKPVQSVEGQSSRESYHQNRAYPGAPPRIPHAITADLRDHGEQCMSCHRFGGDVPSMGKQAPITPHPYMSYCRQCHVPQLTRDPFVPSKFAKPAVPEASKPFLVKGPPPIPHTLQLRENCVGCHNSPGGLEAIQTTHPERVHCRQCHVPATKGQVFERKG